LLEANLPLFGDQGHASATIKNLHTCAALRVVFFAAALVASPPRKFIASIKGQMRFSAELDLRTILKTQKIKNMEITGRLTANAEVRNVKGDKKVTGFTIAINRSYKQGGEKVTKTTYIDCAYWVNSAVAEYLEKGALVLLYGDIDSNAWIDKDGKAQSRLTFHTQNIKILAFAWNKTGGGEKGGSTESPKSKSHKAEQKKVGANNAPDDDDLPF
jgi:single-strand DNA-binding protein